jgi:hypothetical protein
VHTQQNGKAQVQQHRSIDVHMRAAIINKARLSLSVGTKRNHAHAPVSHALSQAHEPPKTAAVMRSILRVPLVPVRPLSVFSC